MPSNAHPASLAASAKVFQVLDTEAHLETRRTHKHSEQVQEMSRLQQWMHELPGTHACQVQNTTGSLRVGGNKGGKETRSRRSTEKDLNIAYATTNLSAAFAKSITITNTALIISEFFLV